MIGWIKQGLAEKHDPVPITASLYMQSEPFSVGSTDTSKGVSAIPFDLLTSESHGLEFDVSEHSVEDGSVINDHVRQKLRQCTITGIFTIHPLAKEYSDKEVDVSKRQPITENRARELINRLESLASDRKPVRLVTSMRIYPEMLIASVQHQRGPQDGESSKFTMVLREFRKVTLRQVVVDAVFSPPDLNSEQNRKAYPQANSGRVSAEPIDLNKLIAPETLGGT